MNYMEEKRKEDEHCATGHWNQILSKVETINWYVFVDVYRILKDVNIYMSINFKQRTKKILLKQLLICDVKRRRVTPINNSKNMFRSSN